MLKRYFIILACISPLVLFARANYQNVNNIDNQTTNTNISQNETSANAIETISNFIGTEVQESESSITANVDYYLLDDSNGETNFVYCKVENLPSDLEVFFLYNDDSEIIEATACPKTFIDDNYTIDTSFLDEKYHDCYNFNNDSFAYKHGEEVAAFLSKEANYRCSTIWVVDSNNQASKIWEDQDNSWTN